jgi:Imidazoleglycerol-phosphate synthase
MGASGEPAEHADVVSWAQLMVDAVRAGGGAQPVSLGDGAWGREVTGFDNGFRIRELTPFVDWVGPHAYQMNDDPIRQHLTPAAMAELSHFGRPVVIEEFGVTTDFTSDEGAADYYRQVLHTTLLAGASGWIAWSNTDLDLPEQGPYNHHPFEMHFGVTTSTGEPKPPLLELQLLHEAARRFGAQCIVLSVDARTVPAGGAPTPSGWEVTTHGGRRGTGIDAVEWAARGQELGVGEILLNSMDADGTRAGFDLAMIAAVRKAVDVPVIASGGAGAVEHFAPAVKAGADAVLAATVFHFGHFRIKDVKESLRAADVEVR